VNQAPEPIPTPNAAGDRNNRRRRCGSDVATPRRSKLKASVRSLVVIVPHVLVEDLLKVASTPDQHPVQTLLSNRPYPPLSDGVGIRCLDRRLDDLDTVGGEDIVEGAGELAVSVPNEEPRCAGSRCPPCFPAHRELSCSLDHPRPIRVARDTGEPNLPRPKFDDKQDVQRRQPHGLHGMKSTATMPEACARRNARHVADVRQGAGRSPLRSSTVRMVVPDTETPSFFSSPWMRR
jgi:hypothetical protein